MPSRAGFTDVDVPSQPGKCFIVTGANTGIGFEVSRVLAARGARVLLACRDKAKAEAAMARIRQATPRADLAFLPLDQADLRVCAMLPILPPASRTSMGSSTMRARWFRHEGARRKASN